jgi:hypothetical protein
MAHDAETRDQASEVETREEEEEEGGGCLIVIT